MSEPKAPLMVAEVIEKAKPNKPKLADLLAAFAYTASKVVGGELHWAQLRDLANIPRNYEDARRNRLIHNFPSSSGLSVPMVVNYISFQPNEEHNYYDLRIRFVSAHDRYIADADARSSDESFFDMSPTEPDPAEENTFSAAIQWMVDGGSNRVGQDSMTDTEPVHQCRDSVQDRQDLVLEAQLDALVRRCVQNSSFVSVLGDTSDMEDRAFVFGTSVTKEVLAFLKKSTYVYLRITNDPPPSPDI